MKLTKLLIVLTFCLIASNVLSQTSRIKFQIDYNPNYSRLTNTLADEEFKLSHSFCIRSVFDKSGFLRPTLGVGFLNVGEKEVIHLGGTFGIEMIENFHSNNYIMVPFGVLMEFRQIYILPIPS